MHHDDMDDLRDVRLAVVIAVILALAALAMTFTGCSSCEPIVRTEYREVPVEITRPCQVPEAPAPPQDEAIPEQATEADVVLVVERAWEAWRAYALRLLGLYNGIPGERVTPP